MQFSPLLQKLIESLRYLPGVGPKTAQRMAFQLLTKGREKGKLLANNLHEAMTNIQHCQECRIFTETAYCQICTSPHRDSSLLCIVENPIDVAAIEQTGQFKGKYFVLLGRLSPLDGMGPNDIGIPHLKIRFANGIIKEIIIATNPTVEGEATTHYLSQLAKPHDILVSRIARGIALGSELEYSDQNTLSHALMVRERISE
jgi:recombination protein RecR